jgi:hypothetical protein
MYGIKVAITNKKLLPGGSGNFQIESSSLASYNGEGKDSSLPQIEPL